MHTLSLGKHNPRLGDIRQALREGALTPDGLLPIEGPKLLEAARASGLEIVEVFLRAGSRAGILPENARIFELDPAVFKTIQDTETSQGVIALARPRKFELAPLLRMARGRPVIVLARLQDPGNAGTILRAAETFDGGGCLALEGTASLYNSKTVRASAGSIFRLPHVWNLSADEVVNALKNEGVCIAGTSPRASVEIQRWDWRRPMAVLIGNEGQGLDTSEREQCDTMLRIPRNPEVESLNSAMAAAVVLYESYRQRALA